VKVGIVAPSPVPYTRGGAERAWAGLQQAIDELTGHQAEVVKLPVREDTLPNLVEGYRAFSELDLSHFDLVVSSKYPAWITPHPRHVVWMFHPLRGLYDTYHVFGLPEFANPAVREVRALTHFLLQPPERARLDDFFAAWQTALDAAGADHPDLALPSPVARSVVHWLDRLSLAPGAVHRHVALSRTIAQRPQYFPPGVRPAVAYAPSDLAPAVGSGANHLFTASRLDGPKRIDLLIRAMAHVRGDLPLLIGGTGPRRDELEALAADDPRIRFCGFVDDDELPRLYADAVAVPFIPEDEDYGLIAVEAMACGRPVVTCTDSGGPTELVIDGVTGLIAPPTPAGLGAALTRLVEDRDQADRLGAAARRRAAEITWPAALATILGEPTTHIPTHRVLRIDRRTGCDDASEEPVAGPRLSARPARPRVVALTTFGIAHPHHGGQLRCHHLYGALARHVDVDVVALVEPGHPEGTRTVAPGLREIAVARSTAHHDVGGRVSGQAGMAVTDIVAGTHIHESPAYLARLRDALRGASVVLLAEPYLLPAVEAVGSALPRLYDAFNVETDLKATSLPGTAIGRQLLDVVVGVEQRAVDTAAAVTTCSAEDAKRLSLDHHRALADFTVIPNGTDCGAVEVPDPADRRRKGAAWRRHWASLGHGREHEALAVFFGSWHPPNLDAAEILLWLAPQLPEVQFVLGGSHGDAFGDRRPPENLVFTGVISERSKRTLLASADVALNPMMQGSGTNLKVIEYLAAGVPVVSTAFGVRGLSVVDGRHLLVAEPHELVDSVRAVLADPDATDRRAAAGRALAIAEYDWRSLGDRLAAVVRTLH
jgi:glycosyltransferase involved in cell wall biosynthesis